DALGEGTVHARHTHQHSAERHREQNQEKEGVPRAAGHGQKNLSIHYWPPEVAAGAVTSRPRRCRYAMSATISRSSLAASPPFRSPLPIDAAWARKSASACFS